MNQRTLAALALLAGCIGLVLAVGALPDPAGASHGSDDVDVTVDPANHDTGAENVTYELSAEWESDTIQNAPYFSNLTSVVVQFNGGSNISACRSEDGGIVGGGEENFEIGVNQSAGDGYQYQAYTDGEATWGDDAVRFTFDGDDGDHPDYGQDDVLEITFQSCVANADEEDWYLGGIRVEGKSPTYRNVSFEETSHYYGICEGCEDDDDARDAMGNPPSEPTPTATGTPTATSSESATPNYPTAQPTDTPTDTPEPTDTPTETATPTETNDTQGTDGQAGREPVDAEVFGMSPLAIVAIVAVVSIGLAALGARRL